MPLTAAAAAHPLLRRERLVRALLLSAGGAATAYALYRLYRSDALQSTARSLRRLRAALAAYADACGTGADTLRLVLADLHAFLQSDRRELPPSLRQLARLMQSPEVADSTSATVAALWRGVSVGGSAAATHGSHDGTHPALDGSSSGFAHAHAHAPSTHNSALDRVLEALLSERGHSLVSVAVSLGARNLVTGFCERGQQLAVLCVSAFVTGGMRAYLDQTLDLNFYEDLFSAMARPEHLEAVKSVVGVFARDVVGAYLAGPVQQQALEAPMAAAEAQQQQPGIGIRLSASIQELMNRAGSSRQQQQVEQQQQQQQAEQRAGDEQEAGGVPAGMRRTGSGNLEWISAVGKEWLNVVQNPQGRTVMVELAGAAAKEAAAGVSAALADRFRLEWMLLAALAMLLIAWLLQRLMAALLG
ncbi:hypothetical protein COHA_005478 [Chlorella ohadii]|uniref:PHLOEM PROTEIN 2-LIKE A10 n=1 Tax=Chlorella ohadii TaxID=2649997 RepID=A0AAD5H679_9CHLO|nr:hypothetical protein COHA_005478 [Chlorella ohadii]